MLDRFFGLTARGTTASRELLAGTTTFLTAGYIIFVHPGILAEAGMDRPAAVVVTCAISAIATLALALWPRVPLMMAPGMGLNAFFTYTLVKGAGVSWQAALGVVFLSGVAFLLLTFVGVRERVMKAIPKNLRIATSAGIGLFLAFIGMQNLGLVADHPATLVQLGPMTVKLALGLCGLLVMVSLMRWRVPGGVLAGILVVWIAAMLLGETPPPDGVVSLPPSPMPLAFQLDVAAALRWDLVPVIFAFMYVDLFDSLGTMTAVCRQAGLEQDDGSIPEIKPMLTADAAATVLGSVLGTSTTTTYVESAVGVAAGGRTGLTSVATAGLFTLALLFTPVVLAVPAFATAPALILVGALMWKDLRELDLASVDDAVRAVLTFALMPLTFSIATGIMYGFISFAVLKLLSGKAREVTPTLGVIAALSLVNLLLA